MKELTVRITRYDREKGIYKEVFQVPREEGKTISVMNVLEYIYQNLDGTLAFFHHAACRQAVCGKCTVKMNGRVVLACVEPVVEDEVELEPYKKDVIKDFVCAR